MTPALCSKTCLCCALPQLEAADPSVSRLRDCLTDIFGRGCTGWQSDPNETLGHLPERHFGHTRRAALIPVCLETQGCEAPPNVSDVTSPLLVWASALRWRSNRFGAILNLWSLSPKFPPASRRVLVVKSFVSGCHISHHLSLRVLPKTGRILGAQVT